jgi:hypothetical protein
VKGEIRKLIAKKVQDFTREKIQSLNDLTLDKLNINVYLIAALNYKKPEQVVAFAVDQFFNRSVVTSFGSFYQELGKMFGKAANIPDIDLIFEREGTRYYVQLKSGPEGFTGPALKKTLSKMAKIKRKEPTSKTIIAFSYGTVNKISKVWGKELNEAVKNGKLDQVLIGRKWWEFVLKDPPGYRTLFDIISQAGTVERKTLNDSTVSLETAKNDAYKRVLKEWKQKYGDDYNSILKMLEDNV